MERKIPLWVTLALSNIKTRKGALGLIWSSLIFTAYCVPWSHYFDHPWVPTLFLIDDWDWFAMMLPMSAWYWLSLRWMDRNTDWQARID